MSLQSTLLFKPCTRGNKQNYRLLAHEDEDEDENEDQDEDEDEDLYSADNKGREHLDAITNNIEKEDDIFADPNTPAPRPPSELSNLSDIGFADTASTTVLKAAPIRQETLPKRSYV